MRSGASPNPIAQPWRLGLAFLSLSLPLSVTAPQASASCMWGVVQPGAVILGRLGGWQVQNTPGVGQSWDIIPSLSTYPPQTGDCNPCMETLSLDTTKTGKGVFFGTIGNTVTIQRVGGVARTFGRLNAGLKSEHGARRGSAWVENGRWVSYPAMADQAPYTRKGASGGHAPNDALARNPRTLPPIVIEEPLPVAQPTPYEEWVYKGTPRQVAKIDAVTGEPVKDANGNIVYETARNAAGQIIYDNDVWEAKVTYPPRTTATPPSTKQLQVAASAFSFEAYPSYILVQNEVITRVYPAYVSGGVLAAKPIRIFGGSQGALWSTDGIPLISDVQYTGGDTTVKWMATGWWQGELQPITGSLGATPSAGGTSHNVITLIDAMKALPVKFGSRDVLADFYLPSGEMAVTGGGPRNSVTLNWDSQYRDGFVQATPPPVQVAPQPQPSPADDVVFYFNRHVNPAHKYKVVANPGPGSSISPDYQTVLAAISKAGQAEVEATLRQGGGTDKHRFGKTWETTTYAYFYNDHHYWTTTTWQERFDWFEGGTIVAVNAATGEILQSLPASDWSKVTAPGSRVQVAGNWVNVVGYAGINTPDKVSSVNLGSRTWQQAHPITISFGGRPDFLAGEDKWRYTEGGRKPVLSAMRAINFDGTGVKMWEWVGPTEGILVWNEKGDRLLQPTGREFFGFNTWGKDWDDGSAPFRTLDKDGSGSVDGAELAKVWVWLDKNGDAKVQDGELSPVTSKGVDSVVIPTEKDDKGGVVAVGGATGAAGKLDVRDWWSVGGVAPKAYSQMVSGLRAQPSIYEWKPKGGTVEGDGGLLRYMTPSSGRVVGLNVLLKNAAKAAKDTGTVPGLLFPVNPLKGGGFVATIDFGDYYTVTQWGTGEDGRSLQGKTVTYGKDKKPVSGEAPLEWTAKHVSGPTLNDVADIASVTEQ